MLYLGIYIMIFNPILSQLEETEAKEDAATAAVKAVVVATAVTLLTDAAKRHIGNTHIGKCRVRPEFINAVVELIKATIKTEVDYEVLDNNQEGTLVRVFVSRDSLKGADYSLLGF